MEKKCNSYKKYSLIVFSSVFLLLSCSINHPCVEEDATITITEDDLRYIDSLRNADTI